MSHRSLVGVFGTGSLGATGPLLIALGLVGLAAISVAIFRAAVSAAEARSRGDRTARLRALDEVAVMGGLRPEEYASRRAAVLNEV